MVGHQSPVSAGFLVDWNPDRKEMAAQSCGPFRGSPKSNLITAKHVGPLDRPADMAQRHVADEICCPTAS
jgi:hypothetical protein